MAEWLGQFSGNTHATKVADGEASLRHAIVVFRESGLEKDRQRKAKSLRNLAERLLSARLRFIRARIAALEPAAECTEEQYRVIASLKEQVARTEEEGVGGILVEFGIQDTLV